jgi:hypothetical protein
VASFGYDVDVTLEDIRNGIKGDCGRCPVALALSRVIPEDHLAGVGATEWTVYDAAYRAVASGTLPDAVCDFIASFDAGDHVMPFSVRLWSRI